VSATANLVGGTKICVIGLDEKAADTVRLADSARISAGGCSVYVNSTSPAAVRSEDQARVTSLLICTAGGYKGASSNFAPKAPTTDCPRTKDPLAGRPTPPVGGCKHNDLVLGAGLHLPLNPGTYCGGLTLQPGAIVTLNPGVYVIKDGPLHVGPPVLSVSVAGFVSVSLLPATLKGTNVAFYFTGTVKPEKDGSVVPMRFMKESVVEMTAPKTGEMAGLLLREDPAAPAERRFEVVSDSARLLVGTIYLPPASSASARTNLLRTSRNTRRSSPSGWSCSRPRTSSSTRAISTRARPRGRRAQQRQDAADTLERPSPVTSGAPPPAGSPRCAPARP